MFAKTAFLDYHYQQTEADFLQYLKETSQQCYISFNEFADNEKLLIKFPNYIHRWSKSYKGRFLLRLMRLQEWYLLNPYPVSFLTLTSKHSKDELIEDQITKLKEGWAKLLCVLRRMIPKLDYFANLDFHKTGYGHMHIILFASLRKSEEKKIRDIWSKKYQMGHPLYSVDFAVNYQDNIQHLVSYIMKHSSKVLHSDETTPGFLRFHSVIWSMGRPERYHDSQKYKQVRLFSMSNRISNAMKLECEEKLTHQVFHVKQGGSKLLYNRLDMESMIDYHDLDDAIQENYRKTREAIKFFCDLDFEIE